MSQSESDRDARASALLDALIDEDQPTSQNEVWDDIIANGGDPKKIAADLREMALGLVMRSRKARLDRAREQWRQQAIRQSPVSHRQPARIRDRLRELVARNASFANGRVALAFRNGITQSDSDLLSLWQDLIDLGAVSDDELGD